MTTLFRIFDFNQSTLLILGLTLSLSLVSESGRGQDALLTTAETVLRYQRLTGGWPKNYDFSRHLAKSEQQKLLEQKKNNDSTIDNGATYREIKILAQAYRLKKDPRFRLSAIEGIEYLLAAQYQNGGWPQTFPNPTGYHRYITYNDNAMIGVLQLLNDISQGNSLYSFTSLNLRRRCQTAVAKGIECILRCQIRVGENRLVWCAQHDHQTLAPRSARSYELASLSGNESVEIIRFLMEIDDPDPRIV
ncbi:MAG: pectate lyase, partial [Planctomycetota bacterium]|nr:pectate lyase [Planctomycetota bacterium]